MVFVQKWRFVNAYFLFKMEQEIVVFEDSERKETFLEQKNIDLKNHQNLPFLLNWLVHGFCQKMKIFNL